MDLATVRSKMSTTQSQINSTNSQLTSVDNQLAEVQAAKKEIEELKDRADELKITLKNVDCEDKSYCRGVQWSSFDENYDQSKQDAKTYYDGLDDLADDLVNTETRLKNEKASLNGNLNWLNSNWRDLCNWLERLTN